MGDFLNLSVLYTGGQNLGCFSLEFVLGLVLNQLENFGCFWTLLANLMQIFFLLTDNLSRQVLFSAEL